MPTTSSFSLSRKLSDYVQLGKLRLSLVVVFSAGVAYLIAQDAVHYGAEFLSLIVGGLLVTLSANAINEIYERDTDALMRRTANRPLPAGRMQVQEAKMFAAVCGIGGVLLLGFMTNWLSAGVGLLSLLLYAFVYTPLKRRTPLAVFVGAVPGALPPVIGWSAAAGELGMGAWILFSIQFFWQLPHFWSIAWLAHEDYTRAGYRLMPSGGTPTRASAWQIFFYTLLLLPVGFLPLWGDLSGWTAVLAIQIGGFIFHMMTLYLVISLQRRAALFILFGSFMYLPLAQLAILLDKF